MSATRRITRRQFLKAGAVIGASAGASALIPWRLAAPWVARANGLPFLDPSSLTRFVDPLPIPPTWSTAQLAGNGLTMAPGLHRFSSQMGWTPTFGYGGASYLGPTIEVQTGVPVSFVARNRLGPHPLSIDLALHGPDAEDQLRPRASLHLHGGYTEPGSDGYPEDTFRPGEDHVYNYVEDQQAGTVWYHDHALGMTRLNVYAGLAGLQPIRDPEAEAGLPSGPYEVPIVLQDKRFLVDAAQGLNPLFYPSPWAPEFFGDVMTVNGAVWPNLNVDRGWYRLRMANGSSSRFYHVSLEPRRRMLQIGSDTGLLERPGGLDRLILAPGERADLLVDFGSYPPNSAVRLLNLPLPDHVVSPADVGIEELMQFTVTAAQGLRGGYGSRAPRPFTWLNPAAAVQRRTVLLTEIMDPTSGEPLMALLNARPWTTTDIERPVVDTLEEWEIVNLTGDTHPIHLHLVQFQLHNRQPIDADDYLEDVFGTEELHPEHVGIGSRPFPSVDGYLDGPPTGPDAWELGWKDTIQAHPEMVTRILVPFGPNAAPGVPFGTRLASPFTGEYVWHCHILDHEDNE
ncbi:MAG TPA: multicopper oxidase domain-containing protein, partial [Candidatus Limnocylindria bacterium]|nr:multicopper oxidase domain-containing protein [Candidatus Limnocylindria bacterium]